MTNNMRDIYQELGIRGLSHEDCIDILGLIKSLTIEELWDIGNENVIYTEPTKLLKMKDDDGFEFFVEV